MIRRLVHSNRVAIAFLFTLAPALVQAQSYTIATFAGNGTQAGGYSGDGGAATSATLNGPAAILFDSSGNLYIADADNNRVRQVNSSGVISTIAGNGTAGFAGDGQSATASGTELNKPSGLALDGSGNLYIADTGNYEVRKVAGGTISTFAGHNSSGAGFAGDLFPAANAKLWNPSSVAVDSASNVYIADPFNNVIRIVCQTQTPTGCAAYDFGSIAFAAGDINTFAGSNLDESTGQSISGYTGDGGRSTGALLNNPAFVLLDSAGNLYISDSDNDAIRKVDTTGKISTIAGDGSGIHGYTGDGGPATKARLNSPKGLAMDSANNLYIADSKNSVIRMVKANGIITTIAGTGVPGFSGDGGLATSAKLNFPSNVAVNGGKIYISDNANNTIRVLTAVAQVPQINTGGVVNGASYTAAVAPGGIADVFGSFYLSSPAGDTSLPLLTSMQNLSFTFGSKPAPLYFVSGGQVNLQVPWELAGQSTASLSATLNGTAGPAETVTIVPFAPAIFTMNAQGTGQGAILDTTYHVVDSSNPATAGTTTILIYCTGLGAVSNQPASGSPAPATPFAETTTTPTVSIGGVPATPSFSGLAPGYVGLYQVNVPVPAGVAAGSAVAVVISMGGVTSNTVTIAVR